MCLSRLYGPIGRFGNTYEPVSFVRTVRNRPVLSIGLPTSAYFLRRNSVLLNRAATLTLSGARGKDIIVRICSSSSRYIDRLVALCKYACAYLSFRLKGE